ncbi:unnamed protein product [Gadus morhua 'NCC']
MKPVNSTSPLPKMPLEKKADLVVVTPPSLPFFPPSSMTSSLTPEPLCEQPPKASAHALSNLNLATASFNTLVITTINKSLSSVLETSAPPVSVLSIWLDLLPFPPIAASIIYTLISSYKPATCSLDQLPTALL